MMQNYSSIEGIINKWVKHTGEEEYNKSEVLAILYDELRKIPCDYLSFYAEIIDVKNYRANFPDNVKKLCQVYFRKKTPKMKGKKEVYGFIKNVYGTDCKIVCECEEKEEKNCDKCSNKKIEMTHEWEANNPEHYYSRVKYLVDVIKTDGNKGCSQVEESFKCITPTTNCLKNYKTNPKVNSEIQYFCDEQSLKIISEKEGEVMLCYYGLPEENGFPMFPNDPYIADLLFWAIEKMIAWRKMRVILDNDTPFYKKYLNVWQSAELKYNSALRKLKAKWRIDDIDHFWDKYMYTQ